MKNRPSGVVDPSGKVGWIVAGALISGGIDFAVQYSQTGNLSDIKWGSVFISAGTGALGVGVSGKIAKIGVTAVSRVVLNTGAAAAISGYSQILKNSMYGSPLTSNLDSAVATSIMFSSLGSSLEEVSTLGILKSRELLYDSLPLEERLFFLWG
ncbi:MAG: hypothetical protein HY952_05785 [Elusimicrobia bacterium]|nr:hypothetical protein [Elusimicrobiota bacterium]